MLKKLSLLYNTIKHLKPIQIKYQLLYRIRKAKPLEAYRVPVDTKHINSLQFAASPPVYKSYLGDNEFSFLNRDHQFGEAIDWRFQEYGALWNYNLQYLNVLLQEDVELPEKLRLLNSVYSSGIILEPYPVSLRSINVMHLISEQKCQDERLIENLYAELNFLSGRLEFHLLGNHLLENIFALLMGGAFFNNKDWITTAQTLLEKELNEQILSDGGHFELSPMYHQIIFFRILELIDWYSDWENRQTAFEGFLREKAAKMWAWLRNMSFENGDIPHFNDSAVRIAYSTTWLSHYAEKLDIQKVELSLGESGYRKINTGTYECRVDCAAIGASYQPGHAHADALSFILYHNNAPLLVEQGTSTYDIGAKRTEERNTKAHNTVAVNNQNQSQVWSGFRVGNRAQTRILEDKTAIVKARHDGYKNLGSLHTRTFQFLKETILITDELEGDKSGVAYFHVHPRCEVKQLTADSFTLKEGVHIQFHNFVQIKTVSYQLADGYNNYQEGTCLVVSFVGALTTKIERS